MRVAAILLVLLLDCAVARAGDEKPLPTRSIILSREGVTYFVEGRRKINYGAEVSVQKGVKIVGRGKDAVLEVAGAFVVHGITDQEVIVENLTIEPALKFEEIRFDMARLYGCRIVSAKTPPVAGKITLENSEFHPKTIVDVSMCDGQIRILNCMFREPVRVQAIPAENKSKSLLKVDIISNYVKARRRGATTQGSPYSGFLGGLFLSGARKAVVRANRLSGKSSEFVDCPTLTFDGNKVNSHELVIRHTKNGYFRGTKIQKCDIYSLKVVLASPAGKKREKVVVDKCWFRGMTKAKEIHEKVIQDGKDDAEIGVEALFRKINKRPLEIAGSKD